MTWLGARSNGQQTLFNPRGLDAGPFKSCVPRYQMSRGTITLETIFPDRFNQPLELLDYERWSGDRRSMNMVLGPQGRLWFAVEKGTDLCVLSLDLSSYVKENPIQISYSWDAYKKQSWLSAENLVTGELNVTEVHQVIPIHLDDLARILFNVECDAVRPAVKAMAFSNAVEPIGYASGVNKEATVLTEFGNIPICDLRSGDLVTTHQGTLTPVVAVLRREVPTVGRWKPICVARPFLNVTQSFLATPDTQILTSGVDAEYHFASEKVALLAQDLASFLPQRQPLHGPTQVYYQVILEEPVAFQMSGANVLPLVASHNTENTQIHSRSALARIRASKLANTETVEHLRLLKHEAIALLSERYL